MDGFNRGRAPHLGDGIPTTSTVGGSYSALEDQPDFKDFILAFGWGFLCYQEESVWWQIDDCNLKEALITASLVLRGFFLGSGSWCWEELRPLGQRQNNNCVDMWSLPPLTDLRRTLCGFYTTLVKNLHIGMTRTPTLFQGNKLPYGDLCPFPVSSMHMVNESCYIFK